MDHWKDFIQAYDLEKFKQEAYDSLLEYIRNQDINDDAPWAAPPNGIRYSTLIIKYEGLWLRGLPDYPIFRVRYNLYLKEVDLNPYYYYDVDFGLNREVIDTFFIQHNITFA
jgi:hypothetical protein